MKTIINLNKIFKPPLYYLLYFVFFIYLSFIIIQHSVFSSLVKYSSHKKKEKILYGRIIWKQRSESNGYILLARNQQKTFLIVPDDFYDDIEIGDQVLLKALFKNISFENNYEFYLYSSFGVDSCGYVNKILKIDKSKSVWYRFVNQLFLIINNLKEKIVELVKVNIEEPYNSVILRLTIGYKDTESENIYKYFQDAGVAHVLVVSGLHVVFVYSFLYFVLKFFIFDRKVRIVFVSFLTIIFMLITGCSPPVVRSTIIVLLFSISELLSRKQNSVRLLIFSAFIILLINPTNLFSASFQLSFIACFGIIYFYPLLFSCLKNFIERTYHIIGYIIKLFLVTTSAQVVTIPILMYYFNKFSIISFVSNVIVVPLTSVLLWLSIFAYITCFLTKLNIVLWKITELLTFVYISIVKFFSQIPYCVINTKRPEILNMFVYYFVVIFLIPILLKSKKYKTLTISVIFALTFLFLNFDFNKNLKITFLNVGLGDCVLLQQKNNNILIDTGDSIQTAMYRISSYLKKQGVFTIHHLVITHPHYPHYGGTEFLIDNFKIENVYLNELIPPDNHEYQDLINKIRQKNINLFFVNKIKKLKLQNTEVLFIPNYTNYFYNEESFYDDNSIFVKIRQNNFSIMLTNDIPVRYLKDKNNLLFLQFPRHGKYKEDIIELENLAIKPKFLVVSTDKYIPELKKIKIPVYTTVDDGDITINVEKLKLRKIKRTIQGVKIYM